MSQICPQTQSSGTSSTSSLPPAPTSASSSSSSNILNTTNHQRTTKIFIYIDSNRDDANEPFSIKVDKPSTSITLDDFLLAIPRPYARNYKYFFKSIDPVLGVIREEITDRQQILPSANGRIAAWLMPATVEQDTINDITTTTTSTNYRRRARQADDSLFTSDTSASEITDIASQDSRDDDRFSSITETTDSSSNYHRRRRRRRRHHDHPRRQRASSMSSMTDSTISMDVVTVVLSLERIKYLGMTVVGESDGGIIVGSIMKGGAVDADGRIQPGDMILQMNDMSFEHISNSDAVRLLRETVKDAKSIKLVIAKRWNDHGIMDDDESQAYFPLPHPAVMANHARQDPIRPIDPRQWVAQTNAVLLRRRSSLSPPPAASSTLSSSPPQSPANRQNGKKYRYDLNLTRNSDMETICRAMQQPQSGLDIRDRVWLKLLLKNSFLGSDLVQWLYKYVDGFIDKQDAKEYAAALLERAYIRHPVAGLLTRGFSKSCYYVFGRSDDDDDDNYTNADETQSQINGLSQLTLEETTINYNALTRPVYGYVDKNNVPVLYASTSSLTSSFNNRKTKSQSSGETGGIRMTPSSFLAKNNNTTLSTIRSHQRPNPNSTCSSDNSILTI